MPLKCNKTSNLKTMSSSGLFEKKKNLFPKQLTFAVVFSRHNAECSFDSFVLPELFFCRALTVQCLVESADVESAHVLSEHYNADTV